MAAPASFMFLHKGKALNPNWNCNKDNHAEAEGKAQAYNPQTPQV